MTDSKFRIKKTELNNGEFYFTPQIRLQKNDSIVYILLTILFPLWFIVFYFLLDKAMRYGKWSVFNPYQWINLSSSCCLTLLDASKYIVYRIESDNAERKVNEQQQALQNGIKVKKTIYIHPEL